MRRLKKRIARWVKNNDKLLFELSISVIVAFIAGWISMHPAIAPRVTVHFGGTGHMLPHFPVPNVWGDLNILLICSVALGLLMVIRAVCWHSQGSWLTPFCVVLFLGVVVTASYVYFSYQNFIKSSDKLAQESQILLTAVGIVLMVFTIVLTAFGIFLIRKVEKLVDVEKKADEVSGLTVITAELAFATLPDFTASHQIPDKSHEALKIICGSVFRSSSPLLEFLDKRGNGATLRYAKGLLLFAENDYPGAKKMFKQIIDDPKAKDKIKSAARYRLGISYRQDGEYDKSVNCFKDLSGARQNKRDHVMAQFGTSITLFAAHKDKKEWWDRLDQNKKRKILNTIYEEYDGAELSCDPELYNQDTLKIYAKSLIKGVLDIQRDNPVALAYLAKIDRHGQNTIVSDQSVLQAIKSVVRFIDTEVPESLNIRASYHLVKGLLSLYRNCHDQAKVALTLAKNAAIEYKSLVGTHVSIFSEEKDRQVPVDEFIKEINRLCSSYSINLA